MVAGRIVQMTDVTDDFLNPTRTVRVYARYAYIFVFSSVICHLFLHVENNHSIHLV